MLFDGCLLTCPTADILSDYDMDMLGFFAFKNSGSGITDETYRKLAFLPALRRRDVEVPSYKMAKRHCANLSGIEAEEYDCCINSCCCFAGPNKDKTACPYCHTSRKDDDGRPRRRFRYIPIIPRLQSLYRNAAIAKEMRYRHDSHAGRDPDMIKDMMDGSNYERLTRTHVVVNEKAYPHMFFDDCHDIALGLSTDGFAPFRRRSKTC
ncbi:hypothetical protein K523DRAFT_254799, partial [Schizophyllum commune Tattone D]